MMAFERLEPFGDLQADLRAGMQAAVLANINRDEKARPEPYGPSDFMPTLRGARAEKKLIGEDLSPDELSALLDAALFGKGKTVH